MVITPLVIVIVLGIVAAVVIVVGVISMRSERDLVEERLGRYEQGFESFLEIEDEADTKASKEEKRALDAIDKAISKRPFAQKWRLQLARADIKLTVAEFAAAHVVAMAGFFSVAYFVLFRGDLIMSIVAGFVGLFAPRIYVSRQTSGRLVKFEEQLPDTLGLWVNALRSGFSVLQAMEAISRDAPNPTGMEFKRVVQEVQLGIDLEDALEHLLARVESDDLDLVVTAVNVQREVGGNLAEILDIISHTIRERVKLKGEIRVLTSQGRYTGYLISLLPILVALFLNTVQPGFMGPMFESRTCGWPMLGIGLALIGMGMAAIQKIVNIDI
ncbi:MAG TPA: type II secretion system F family protein [Aggregatilineales bacterium]|nr:type II secretion system F family protein [Anaerolineae bacterium]HUN08961.1 type II secretion system F family protein [Aggregatilineales bacterium]